MTFSAKDLLRDEKILLEARPHLSRLAAPAFCTLIGLAPVVAGFVLWHNAPVWFGWLLLAGLSLDAGFFSSRIARWRSTIIVVTNRRLMYRRGVLSRAGREIRIDSISSVRFHQTILERIAFSGSVIVSVNGSDDEVHFPDIARPSALVALLHDAGYEESPERTSRHREGQLYDDSMSESPTTTVVRPRSARDVDRLTELHQRGVITAAELERARRGSASA